MLPDGSVLGGSLHWMIPAGAPATKNAGGWVLQGTFMVAGARLDRDTQAASSLAPVLIGSAFYCRFTDAGPKCIPVKVANQTIAITALAAFSLQDGDAQRDVLWLGVFGAMPMPGQSAQDIAMGVREIHRCETSDEENEVKCKLATMK
jgi:hypothetical protein